MAVWVFIYKTVLSNTVASYIRGFRYLTVTLRWIQIYIKICTSNTCKGQVSGCDNESLRRETFFFLCQGQMNVVCVYSSQGKQTGDMQVSLDDSFLDQVKQLVGQLTAFPVTFLKIIIIQRLTEPILANFGLKLFQPKQRKADTCSSYKHGHFIMAP